MRFARCHRYLIIALGAFLVLFGASYGIYLSFKHKKNSDARIARDVVTKCSTEKDRDVCYEQTIPPLMDHGVSMAQAYEITRIVQELDPNYRYCHVLAHLIARRETAKDPSRWKDVVAQAPAGMCDNGGLHGAFQERFADNSLPDASITQVRELLNGVCDPRQSWQPTFLQRSSCMHGVGHLTMYITDANIKKSVALCDALGSPHDGEPDFRRTCTDGAFMQIFEPLEESDKILAAKIAPATSTRMLFCNSFSGLARTSCIKESWPMLGESFFSASGIDRLCAPLAGEADEYRYCITGSIFVVFSEINFDTNKMMDVCADANDSIQKLCYARTASRFVDTDWRYIPQALDVCARAPAGAKNECYAELTQFAAQGLQRGSPEQKDLCGGMPDPWMVRCIQRISDPRV